MLNFSFCRPWLLPRDIHAAESTSHGRDIDTEMNGDRFLFDAAQKHFGYFTLAPCRREPTPSLVFQEDDPGIKQ